MFEKVISTTSYHLDLQIYLNTSQAKIPQESCFHNYYYTFPNNIKKNIVFIKKKRVVGKRERERGRPVNPYPETSSNEFRINRKHREWRIRPVVTNNIAVKKRFKPIMLSQHMQQNHLKYPKHKSYLHVFHG